MTEPLSFTLNEDIEAERFAEALERLDAGDYTDIDSLEDPRLFGMLQTAQTVSDVTSLSTPRAGYRARSRALILEAAQPLEARHIRETPLYNRTSVLVPFATAAAAAGLTLGAVLGASSLGYGPGANSSETVSTRPAPSGDDRGVQNLTQVSIRQDLSTLQSSIDAVVAAASRGEEPDAQLLRDIEQSTRAVSSLIEASPRQLPTNEVVAYFQTAATARIVLGEVHSGAPQPELIAAREESEKAVSVAQQHLLAIQDSLALGRAIQ